MKRQTKLQKFNDLANAVKQMRKGEPVRRIGAKDRSIQTHPVIDVPDVLEKIILQDCLDWLRKKKIVCDRNNTGAGEMGTSGFYNYGIKNGGDIIGLTEQGIHFELECKRGRGGRLSIGQQKRMQIIRNNGGTYLVIHGWQELEYYDDTYHYFS